VFLGLGSYSSVGEYVSEAVKLVRMLPRIREVSFGWWTASTGMEQIARAFATISTNSTHHAHLPNHPSASMDAFAETRAGQTPTNGPLKVHLELVDFGSVHTFLDFLESFGGRVRELSLLKVAFGGGGGNEENDIWRRSFPGIQSVYLDYDTVVKGFGRDGPTMGNMDLLFGTSAIEGTHDLCDILELIAPNVSELQLFRDDFGDVSTCWSRGAKAARTLRLPRFRKLELVTMSVPGPHWTDLIYEIAAWFGREEWLKPIADHDSRASPPSPAIPSLPSSNLVTRVDLRKGRKRTRVRFAYPVRNGDIDWKKMERAVLGEDIEDLDGGCDCSVFGKLGRVGRESEKGGKGNDHVDEMVMTINQVGNHVAGGSCSARFTAGSLWVEVASGSAVLGDLRGELGRLDQLGLLQVSLR